MINFVFLVSRQGKTRLERFFGDIPLRERPNILKSVIAEVVARPPQASHITVIEDQKVVYKRQVCWAIKMF